MIAVALNLFSKVKTASLHHRFRFNSADVVGTQIETEHIMLIVVVGPACLLLFGLIAREIFLAANPDKRPLKRKRR